MSSILAAERKRVSFPLHDLSVYIYRGEERLQKVKDYYKVLTTDPLLKNDASEWDLSRMEQIRLMAKKTSRTQELLNLTQSDLHLGIEFWNHNFTQLQGSISYTMYIPYIRMLGTDEQYKQWGEPAERYEIIGAYAQTELGHGSDIQSLETTATFDEKTDEFIIHSPTLTSTKWWPGELGWNANTCVCFAQMIIKGKNHGVHSFVVPIRDRENNKPLPGIKVGDIGPKLGYASKDNGFVRFDNVRVPRANLLARYTNVDREGKYERRGNEKISYAVMMTIRDLLNHSSWKFMANALTIAIRYSIIRTQFKAEKKGPERQVIDYQTQQDKLLTNLAMTYAIHSGAWKATEIAQENVKRIYDKNDFSLMGELHAILSGCKAIYSWDALEQLNIIRMSAGGHGYSSYSGLPLLQTEYAVNCTHEGENTVMALQTARFLIGNLTRIQNGKKALGHAAFLNKIGDFMEGKVKCKAESADDFCIETLDQMMAASTIAYVLHAGNRLMEGAQAHDGKMKESWDKEAGSDLVEAARSFIYYFSFSCLRKNIQGIQNENLRKAMETVCCLFAADRLIAYPQGMFESEFIKGSQFKLLKDRKNALMKLVRNDAIGLVDAFIIPDNTLKSAIGVYDGSAYETLWDWVNNKNRVNTTDEIQQIWKEHIKPIRKINLPKPRL